MNNVCPMCHGDRENTDAELCDACAEVMADLREARDETLAEDGRLH